MSMSLTRHDFLIGSEAIPYTVVGRYPNGKSVVVHCAAKKASDAHRAAIQQIAFDVYGGQIPDGLDPINEAIDAIENDFQLVAILEGHAEVALSTHECPVVVHTAEKDKDSGIDPVDEPDPKG